jgi:TonB family protein
MNTSIDFLNIDKREKTTHRPIPLILFTFILFSSFRPVYHASNDFCQKSDSIYNKAEIMPMFKGKDFSEFIRWVESEIQYPPEAISKKIIGCVTATFVVEKDGTVSYVKVLKSVPELDEEAKRILKSSPKWTPGMINNTAVRVSFTIPVVFRTTFPSDEKLRKTGTG